MIVPSKNQKTYGVLHTENYFSFLGFCKKVNSDEIQKVDIYLDDVLIDTIIADKHLQKIEDIYELDGFGFSYDLPEEYVGQKSLISFKNHETQENLQNSPYVLIDKDNIGFNQYRLVHSLNNINIPQLENLFMKDSISIMFDEQTVEEKYFCDYIKDLCKRFPTIKINFITFYKKDEKLIKTIFSNYLQQINTISPDSIYELARQTEIFLYTHINHMNLYYTLLKYSNEIICLDIRFRRNIIKDYDNEAQDHEIFINPLKYNLSNEEIRKYEHSFTRIIFERAYHKIIDTTYSINTNTDGIEFYFFERINLVLKNLDLKHFVIKNFFKKLRS